MVLYIDTIVKEKKGKRKEKGAAKIRDLRKLHPKQCMLIWNLIFSVHDSTKSTINRHLCDN